MSGLLDSSSFIPYRVVDLGHGLTPYQTRCRWPECSWKSRWHPRQQPADLEYTRHIAATHARGGEAA